MNHIKQTRFPNQSFGVEPHTVKELPALPVRERRQDNMLQQNQDNMLEDGEVVSFGQRAQQQDQQQLQLRQHNIPHNPVYPKQFATAIFLFDALKEIQVITGFGPDCFLSMKTDSAVALKQMNSHTVTVRTRTAAQKLAFLRELIYQDVQIQPIYIPGLRKEPMLRRSISQGPALRKAQEYLNLRHVVTPVVSTIRVIGLDRKVADSSASERGEEHGVKEWLESSYDSDRESVSPCRSSKTCLGQMSDQEGRQETSQVPIGTSVPQGAPLLCRLRMNLRDQDSSNILLQDYRCVVTIIRQEDVDLGAHDNCSSLPCVCGSSCHMPRDKASSAHKKTKPQPPAPKGAIGQADDRAKADKVAQRLARDQAKLKAYRMLQLTQPRLRWEAETLHLIHPQSRRLLRRLISQLAALKP